MRICWKSLMTGPLAGGTIITSQLLVEHWHSWIGDATIADAMLDWLLQRTHRITLKGESHCAGPSRGPQGTKTLPRRRRSNVKLVHFFESLRISCITQFSVWDVSLHH